MRRHGSTFELVYAAIVKQPPDFSAQHEQTLLSHYRGCLSDAGIDLPDDLFELDLRHSIIRHLFVVMYMAEIVEGMPEEAWREIMVSTFAAMERHDCWALLEQDSGGQLDV